MGKTYLDELQTHIECTIHFSRVQVFKVGTQYLSRQVSSGGISPGNWFYFGLTMAANATSFDVYINGIYAQSGNSRKKLLLYVSFSSNTPHLSDYRLNWIIFQIIFRND